MMQVMYACRRRTETGYILNGQENAGIHCVKFTRELARNTGDLHRVVVFYLCNTCKLY
jgi:hypothetical protein